jgi:hypothetical protein
VAPYPYSLAFMRYVGSAASWRIVGNNVCLTGDTRSWQGSSFLAIRGSNFPFLYIPLPGGIYTSKCICTGVALGPGRKIISKPQACCLLCLVMIEFRVVKLRDWSSLATVPLFCCSTKPLILVVTAFCSNTVPSVTKWTPSTKSAAASSAEYIQRQPWSQDRK